jgi:hypothetical protein
LELLAAQRRRQQEEAEPVERDEEHGPHAFVAL